MPRNELQSLPRSPVPGDLLDRAETLTGALGQLVERFPDFPCLTLYDRKDNQQQLSLQDFWAGARRVEAALRAHGLEPGACVVVIMPTWTELVSAYFGVLLAGGAAALLATPSHRIADTRVYTAHVGRILANARAPLLYCDAEVAELLRADPGVLGGTRLLTPADVEARPASGAPRPVRPGDVATIQYSSGSTGAPKGVRLTHAAILDNLRAVRTALELRPNDVTVNWIPLYHDMGLIDAFLLPLLCGCATVLIPTMDFMRDPSLWLWSIHRYRGAQSWAPNFAYNLCATRIADDDLEGLDLSSWRLAVNASEPVLPATLRAFAERFAAHGFRPTAATPMYGLAENVTGVTAHPPGEAPRIDRIDQAALVTQNLARPAASGGIELASCGVPLRDYDVEIRDAEGVPLPERRVGSIWVRSKALFCGYQDDPEATSRALVDGWLHTGDCGYMADGHLYFVAREKDLIVIGGEKYAPQDVEAAINLVPGVREGCAVAFGVVSRERGTEELAAVVETKEEDPARLAEMERAIRERVARATGLGVRHLKLVPVGGIKKTTSGKLARSATRDRYAADLGR